MLYVFVNCISVRFCPYNIDECSINCVFIGPDNIHLHMSSNRENMSGLLIDVDPNVDINMTCDQNYEDSDVPDNETCMSLYCTLLQIYRYLLTYLLI